MSESGATLLFVIFIDTFNGNLYSQKVVVVVSTGTSGPDKTLWWAGSGGFVHRNLSTPVLVFLLETIEEGYDNDDYHFFFISCI